MKEEIPICIAVYRESIWLKTRNFSLCVMYIYTEKREKEEKEFSILFQLLTFSRLKFNDYKTKVNFFQFIVNFDCESLKYRTHFFDSRFYIRLWEEYFVDG